MRGLIIKIILKLINNDKTLYRDVLKEIITKDEMEFVKEMLDINGIYSYLVVRDVNIENISNCIIMNAKIDGCEIKEMSNNKFKQTVITNNIIKGKVDMK